MSDSHALSGALAPFQGGGLFLKEDGGSRVDLEEPSVWSEVCKDEKPPSSCVRRGRWAEAAGPFA